ncbi:hypothetical protein [Microbulbifer taiwanensis]|uniref:hypothetical protein n=1 Tax=Microbulbifer taiwanensis TaxID=986746 RepID=UPI00360766D6
MNDDAGVERFLEEYGVHHPQRMIFGRRRRPTSQVSIVTARHGAPEVESAIWHLYLEKVGDSGSPTKSTGPSTATGRSWASAPSIENPVA